MRQERLHIVVMKASIMALVIVGSLYACSHSNLYHAVTAPFPDQDIHFYYGTTEMTCTASPGSAAGVRTRPCLYNGQMREFCNITNFYLTHKGMP